MRPLFRSILLARPAVACSASTRPPAIRQLHLNSRLSRLGCCQFPQRQQQQLGQIRWMSSPSTPPGGQNGTGPGSGGNSDRPPPPPLPPGPDFKNLPSQKEFRRSDMAKKVSKAMEDLQVAVFTAGQKLNVLTGYSEIEALKKEIEQLEAAVESSRAAVRAAKEDYQAAIARRSASQREVNELLQRKHTWSPPDLERFTELYRSDHANEQSESAAQEQLAVAERVSDEVQAKLSRSILSRYHEEQIWSDKIRRASTWVTWGLMGFNVLLFVIVQLWLEPWKRKRLVGGFEEKVREVIQEEGLRNALLNLHVEPEAVVAPIMNMVAGKEAELVGEGATGVGAVAVAEREPVPPEEDILHSPAGEDEVPAEELATREAARLAAIEAVEEQPPKSFWEKVTSVDVRTWPQHALKQLDEAFSDQVICIRKIELTTVLLEMVALGAFTSALVSLLLSKR